tara:strand:- start:133 stop:696 length:564 start_codon:yes stop_codon:yes gene_type:complete
MKKSLMLIFAFTLLAGCFELAEMKTSDGKVYTQVKTKWENQFDQCTMDQYWWKEAALIDYSSGSSEYFIPMQALVDCFAKRPAYQLCNDWDYAYQEFFHYEQKVMRLRNAISKSLITKNEDPLKCRNPGNDAMTKANIEIAIANQKAANAEARAAAAKKNAQQNKKKCRDVEIIRSDGSTYWGESCK